MLDGTNWTVLVSASFGKVNKSGWCSGIPIGKLARSQDSIEKRGGYCWETMGLSMGLSCFCMSCEGGTNCSFLLLYYLFKAAYIGKQREDLLTVQNFKDNVSHWDKALLKKFIKKDLGSQKLEFLSCDTNSLHVQHLPGLVARATNANMKVMLLAAMSGNTYASDSGSCVYF